MIQVSNLTKKYGNHLALNDVSFHVEKGHIYGLLGPNGAGKSTTMNIITGYITPTEGSVVVNGFDLATQPKEAKQCIGYLPEIPPLYPDMNVEEYLAFAAAIKKVPGKERKEEVKRVMELTNVTNVSKRLIKNLSKGYKQRVGIAQALLGSPELIILDEPTVGLDPEQIIEIRTLISGLKEHHTVILSSHILSEISAVCDEVLMIAKGKVVAMDTTENILQSNRNSQKLEVLLKGERDVIETLLSGLNFVEKYQFVKEVGNKCLFEVFASEEEEDIREMLSQALFDAKILIIELRSFAASLEDIYLEIIQECAVEEAEEDESDENESDDLESDDEVESEDAEENVEEEEEE